ncbi:MAG TPA: phosphonate metabolism protein/1,5-bisphosphokinase (PRPP-forming) PhnN [Xanthobacteraceae bacterium]
MSTGAPRIGPGLLVVVVGPSGAGKDTLIGLARALCAQESQIDPRIVFPRRIVTREPSAAEDHDSIAPSAFDAAVGQGAFAFWWEAHGLKYALPAAIDAELKRGKTVVCNVSRGVVRELRARYLNVTVVLVTAPKQVLLERLAARGREGGGDVAERVARAAPVSDDLAPDIVIENVGDPHEGARRLVGVLRAPTRP